MLCISCWVNFNIAKLVGSLDVRYHTGSLVYCTIVTIPIRMSHDLEMSFSDGYDDYGNHVLALFVNIHNEQHLKEERNGFEPIRKPKRKYFQIEN
jgi:hypothetical protein